MVNFKYFGSKFAAAAASGVLLASAVAPAVSVMGADRFTYDPVKGGETEFKKYLIMSAGDKAPNVTFNFTVAPGQAVSENTSDNPVFRVYAGVGTPTIETATFAPGDDDNALSAVSSDDIDVARTADKRSAGLTAANGVEFETSKGEKYVKKVVKVNFSNCSFPEPGIYRYIVSETANASDEARGIMHDNDIDRVLDVYVTDDGNGSLVVSGYVMHTDINDAETPRLTPDMGTGDVQQALAKLSDKTDGFTNEYKSKDLVVKKAVSGNQASRDKYFAITVKLSGLTSGDKYVVSLGNDNNPNTTDGDAETVSGTNAATIAANQNKTNVQELTAGNNGTIEQTFYLQHGTIGGQYIAVRGLPLNAKYEITENKEDYKSTPAGVENFTDPVKTGEGQTISTIAGDNKAAKTSYLNTNEGFVPTGAIIEMAPYAVPAAIGGLGVIGVWSAMKKKKKEE